TVAGVDRAERERVIALQLERDRDRLVGLLRNAELGGRELSGIDAVDVDLGARRRRADADLDVRRLGDRLLVLHRMPAVRAGLRAALGAARASRAGARRAGPGRAGARRPRARRPRARRAGR